MGVGFWLQCCRSLLRHGMCLRFVQTVPDEMPRQVRKRNRHWRRATDTERDARAMSFVVDRDLGGGRSNSEVAMPPADLSESGAGLLLAPSRPVDFLETFVWAQARRHRSGKERGRC